MGLIYLLKKSLLKRNIARLSQDNTTGKTCDERGYRKHEQIVIKNSITCG